MVARLLGNHFVTGRAIYTFTLERQGGSLEECGLRCQLLSAFGLAGTLEKGGRDVAGVNQSSSTTPTCPPGALFCSRKPSAGGCVRAGHTGMGRRRWKDALGTPQTSKAGLENMQRSLLFLRRKPCRVHAVGCGGPGDGDEPDQGMGMSLGHPAELPQSPSSFPPPSHPACSARAQT